jgi:sugar phosphate isomerase/epimerase
MTLPYMKYSFERSLQGISQAGFRYIAFGLPHAGSDVPDEQDPQAVTKLQRLFDQYGVEPIMLVSTNQLAPGQPIDRVRQRFEIARALGIPELLSLGVWGYQAFPDTPLPEQEIREKSERFAEQFRNVAKLAEEYEITVTLKPHTGNTATASHLIETIASIGSPFVKASYDPGNVHFYEGIDPVRDMELLPVSQITSFIAKDHRGGRAVNDFPIPGKGDVDFGAMFRNLHAGGFNGPVVVERVDGTNATAPTLEELDATIREARIELEALLQKLQ